MRAKPRLSPRSIRLIRTVAVPLILGSLSLLLAACGGGGTPTFTLNGYVRSQATGLALSNAQVTSTATSSVARTDQQGWYQLVGLPSNAGQLTVTAAAPNYQASSQTITPPSGGSARQDFQLAPANPQGSAGVNGTVTLTDAVWSTAAAQQRAAARSYAAAVVQPTFRPALEQPARHVTVELRPGVNGLSLGSPYSLQAMMEQVRDLLVGAGLPRVGYRVFPHLAQLGLRIATVEVPAGTLAEILADRLRRSDAVWRAEPAQYAYPLGYSQRVPNDPEFRNQDHLLELGLPQTWAVQPDAGSQRVAFVDTGVRPADPDLQGNLVPGYDYVNNDNDPTDPGSDEAVSSHGTHVAGLIGARTNNALQVAGTSWRTQLIPLRSLDVGDTPIEYTAEAIAAAAQTFHADVINLSLGVRGQASPQTQQLLRQAVDAAIASGATVVAAAGNEGQAQVSWPAAYQPVIAVGAVDSSWARASFSNYGPQIQVMSPGVNILSTSWNKATNSYAPARASGTSMATPIVSGIVALMRQAGVAPAQIREVLARTAMDIGAPGHDDQTGFGVVNPYLAVSAGQGVDPAQMWIGLVGTDNSPLSPAVHPTFNPNEQGNWSYQVTGVRPGSGFVFAWLDVDRDGQLTAGDYVAKYPDSPVPLMIAAGQVVSAPLDLGIFAGASATVGAAADPQATAQIQRLWEGLHQAIQGQRSPGR